MADYNSILTRAINALADNNETARAKIYDKARAALMRQLSSLEPTLSPEEISKQRLQLEDSITELEAQFGGEPAPVAEPVAPPPPPEPVAPPPPPEPVVPVEPEPAPVVASPPPPPEPVVPVVEEPVAPPPPPEPVVTAPPLPEPIAPQPVEDTPPPAPTIPEVSEPVQPSVTNELSPVDPTPPETPEPILAEATVSTPELPNVEPVLEPEVPVASVDEPTLPEPAVPSFEQTASSFESETKSIDTPSFVPEPKEAAAPIIPSLDQSPAIDAPAQPAPEPAIADTAPGINLGAERDEVTGIPADAPSDHDLIAGSFEQPKEEFETTQEAETKSGGKSRQAGFALVGVLVLLVALGIGAFTWAQGGALAPVFERAQSQISGLFALFSSDDENGTQTPSQPTNVSTNNGVQKDEDRLSSRPLGERQDNETTPLPDRVVLPETDNTPAVSTPEPVVVQPETPPAQTAEPESIFTPPSAEPDEVAQTTPAAPAEEPVAPTSNLFGATAILYEEQAPGSGQTNVSNGSVIWELLPEGRAEFNSSNLPSVRGNATVQARDLRVRFEIVRNLDASLPASHIIEIEFIVGPLFDGNGISNINGVVLKPQENQRGRQLVGAVAKVSENVFWLAMSASAADLASNTDSLTNLGWIDIPVVFESGKRAILTIEKGAAGDAAIDRAFAAWNAS